MTFDINWLVERSYLHVPTVSKTRRKKLKKMRSEISGWYWRILAFFVKLDDSLYKEMLLDDIAIELGKLQDSVPPFSGITAKKIIENSWVKNCRKFLMSR